MERQSRKQEREALRQRLEPLLATALSNNEVARRAQTSATTVARYRKQSGIAIDVVKGGDGKDYAVGGESARIALEVKRHLNAVRALMVPEEMPLEVISMVEEIHESVQRVKA